MVSFSHFVNDVVSEIYNINKNSPDVTQKLNATVAEKLVVQASRTVCKKQNLNCEIYYKEGGHAFPDVTYTFCDGSKFGIEVKSSTTDKKDWSILGNSILGSTGVDDLLDTYIIYIKSNKYGFNVKSARYEDSIEDVVVTHSPRYKINLIQSKENSFFCRSGLSYELLKNSDNPIQLVTDYFKRCGQSAWWLSESTPASLRAWSDLTSEEKQEIYGHAFLFFPELLSNSSTKYKKVASWLAVAHSIVDSSLRDKFTAGGKADMVIGEDIFKSVPKIVHVFRAYLDSFYQALESVDLKTLQIYWEDYEPHDDTMEERLDYWRRQIKKLIAFNGYNDLQSIILSLLI